MQLNLAFSPCPNDTFIFDALVNHKIKTDLNFEVILKDVQDLNAQALLRTYEVTKISFATYPLISEHYEILNSGAALGYNCGPMLISKDYFDPIPEMVNSLKIGIPGRLTTANLLFTLAFPDAIHKKEMLFSEIENGIVSGNIDAGLIIHENRFTYQAKGLKKIIDLGEFWQSQFDYPIPLGCIVVKRNLPRSVKMELNNLIEESILFAQQNILSAMPYIKLHAQEMSEEVMMQHIHLYVNDFSLNLGDKGKEAVNFLFAKGFEHHLLPAVEGNSFLV